MALARKDEACRWARSFVRLSIALSALSACRRQTPTRNDGRPAGSASAALSAISAVVPPPGTGPIHGCVDLGTSPALTVGQAIARRTSADPEEDDGQDLDLPFTVELGAARASAGRFAVGGIQNRAGATFAFAAVVTASGTGGQSVELGRVFGDVEPPSLAPYNEGWVLLVPDNDAGSVVLRVVTLAPPFDAKSLRRGPEITGVRRDALEFSVAARGDEALVAFTKLEKGRGLVSLARFDLKRLTPKGSPPALSFSGIGDAEAPRLSARAGGYFLAWVTRGPAERAKVNPSRSTEADAGAAEPLLDEGPTAIEVLPLDSAGVPVGPARRVTPPSARVIAFDLATTPDDGALLIYRDEHEGPGLEHSNVEAVSLRPDGSFSSRTWELPQSPGLPSILIDVAPRASQPWAWLSVPSETDAGLLPIAADATRVGPLGSEPHLAGTEVLAMQGGRMFISKLRGGQRDLSVVECKTLPF